MTYEEAKKMAREILKMGARLDGDEFARTQVGMAIRTLIVLTHQGGTGLFTEFPAHQELGAFLRQATTDPAFFDGTRDALAWAVREGRELPDEARAFASDLLSGAISKPKLRGRSPNRNIPRDRAIIHALRELEKRGITPTRNDASPKAARCGCDVVADVLEDMGLPGQETPSNVWKRREQPLYAPPQEGIPWKVHAVAPFPIVPVIPRDNKK